MSIINKKIKIDKMQYMLDCFSELSGIRVAYYDDMWVNVAGKNKPMCGFCESIRRFPEFDLLCKQCDAAAFDVAVNTWKTQIYRCHMGLWEAVVPIFIKGQNSGLLMLGQIRCKDKSFSALELKDMLVSHNIADDKLLNILEHYTNMNEFEGDKLEAAAGMLEIIASHIINTDIIQIYELEAVQKARVYIEQHFKENISTKLLAETLGISVSSLCTLFKKQIGFTVGGYAESLRINTAKDMLATTSMSVKQISFMCGFEDPNYFSRAFKKSLGKSPIKFREEIKI